MITKLAIQLHSRMAHNAFAPQIEKASDESSQFLLMQLNYKIAPKVEHLAPPLHLPQPSNLVNPEALGFVLRKLAC